MKPKIKRKKYAGGNSIWDTSAVPSDVMAGMPQTDNVLMDPSQVTTNAQSTVGPLSGIQPSGIGSAAPVSTGMSNATGSLLTAAGTTGLKIASNAANSSAPRTTAGYMTRNALKGASTGAGIGSTIGGIAGSFIPGVGNVVGGLAGGMAGAEIGALAGATKGFFEGNKARKNRNFQEQQDVNARKDALAMQQQYADQTIGTQQTNPVYGMKHGGSLYEMGGNVQKKSFNGIIHSDKNGVDKTKASMPEGTFVVDADHLKQAVKHGVIEPQKVSPHQGGVPIMITGGKVAPEGVISPDKVKQLLAMGVDLDKYAPNADTSIYDLAGTRKNVKNGGRLGYVDAGTVKNKIKFDANQYIDDTSIKNQYNSLVEPIDEWQRIQNKKTQTEIKENAYKEIDPAWLSNQAFIDKYHPQIEMDAKKTKKPKTPMTDEEKLRAAQYGILGVEAATQIGEGLWNLGRQRTPVPKPQRFISTPYTPNVSAMDAAHQASQDKALATSLYNIRQSGGGAENFNAMHANELENDLSYNAQRTNVTEGARQANTTQENADRANYANSLYAYGVNEASATDSFRAAKAQAVTKNIDNLMVLGTQAVDVKKSQVENLGDKFTTDYSNANYRAHSSGIGTFSASEYRSNKDAINSALDNISLLQSKYPTDYAKYANDVKGMNPIAANAFLISKLNK